MASRAAFAAGRECGAKLGMPSSAAREEQLVEEFRAGLREATAGTKKEQKLPPKKPAGTKPKKTVKTTIKTQAKTKAKPKVRLMHMLVHRFKGEFRSLGYDLDSREIKVHGVFASKSKAQKELRRIENQHAHRGGMSLETAALQGSTNHVTIGDTVCIVTMVIRMMCEGLDDDSEDRILKHSGQVLGVFGGGVRKEEAAACIEKEMPKRLVETYLIGDEDEAEISVEHDKKTGLPHEFLDISDDGSVVHVIACAKECKVR